MKTRNFLMILAILFSATAALGYDSVVQINIPINGRITNVSHFICQSPNFFDIGEHCFLPVWTENTETGKKTATIYGLDPTKNYWVAIKACDLIECAGLSDAIYYDSSPMTTYAFDFDVNGDGYLDRCKKTADGLILFKIYNNGFDSLTSYSGIMTGFGGSNFVPVSEMYDADGDGYIDLMMEDVSTGNTYIDLYADGFGGSSGLALFASGFIPQSTGEVWDEFIPNKRTKNDYDGDGKADIAVKTNLGGYYIDYSSNGFGSWDVIKSGYGDSTVKNRPDDYDGDGKTDISIKTLDGRWLIDYASNGFGTWDVKKEGYGGSEAVPANDDYDGDGKADIAVKTNLGGYYIDYASNGFGTWDLKKEGYGGSEAVPANNDYDGDGKADIAVKTNLGGYYIDYASNGFGKWDVIKSGYGDSTVKNCPDDYDGDYKGDISIKTLDGRWLIDYASNGFGTWDLKKEGYGGSEAVPANDDYDGDGKADIAVKTSDNRFLIDYASNGFGSWDKSVNLVF